MFVIAKSPTFKWPVTLKLPVDNVIEESTFTAEYKRLPTSEYTEMFKQWTEGKVDARDVCRKVVVGWSDIVDGQGAPVNFSTATLEALLEVPNVAPQLMSQFVDATLGKSKEKN